ncbi:MAG: hypothetical protein EON61_02030 [Alphaproteobacteria bacterium]|nr:MAG: hypothetical protein EON61_02030 [Alphaproteobacteria bacterium]
MRGFLFFLGLLLIAVGGAVAGAQYANLDLSALDAVAGAKAFLLSPNALYAGGGAAALGLLLIVISAATGGKKRAKPTKAAATKQATQPEKPLSTDSLFDPEPAPPLMAQETQRTVIRPVEKPQAPNMPKPVVGASDQPPWSQPATAPSAKPTASSQPPDGYDPLIASRSDPRLLNRKRVTDLVSVNDALKAYHAKHGAYPKAEGLLGAVERGDAWIPGLAPEFIPQLPQDPSGMSGQSGAQYVYASDGRNYKLLAQGVSLIGGTNVEVLGVRIDPTRRPTAENASFGFWTPEFASA